MGQLVAYNEEGQAVGTADLVALEGSKEGGPLSHIGIADEDVPLFILILTAALILIIIIILIATKKKRIARRRRKRRRQRSSGSVRH